MDAHAVPQNVTDFEFHLVGDMTLKQFGYLALGLVLAYITFILFADPLPYLAYPLILIFGLSGAAFAFIPIMERPLDHWVISFFKAIFLPTKRDYKSSILPKDAPIFDSRLSIYLNSIQPNLPAPEVAFVPTPAPVATPPPPAPKITMPVAPPPQPAPAPTPSPAPKADLPTPQELSNTVNLAKQAQDIQNKISIAEKQLAQIRQSASAPGADPGHFTQSFQTALSELQMLNKQASDISRQMAILTNTPTTAVTPKPVQPVKAVSVPNITLTTTPNIINGIVTDINGNYLEGAIVVAHDSQQLPVRALKTNKLGQFIAATPLADGRYTINIEKDGLTFDVLSVELKGEVIKPIIVAAKPGAVA